MPFHKGVLCACSAFFALSAVNGCDKPKPTPEAPPPELPALGEPACPAPDEPNAIALPGPATPPALAWDLAENRLHSYKLHQEASSTMIARFRGPLATEFVKQRYARGKAALTDKLRAQRKPEPEIARVLAEEDRNFEAWLKDPEDKRASRIRSEGYVDFRGLGGGLGRIEYKLGLREYVVDGAPQNVNEQPATLFTAQVEESGRIFDVQPVKGEADPVLFDVLFAIPPRPLAKGETFERTINFVQKGERPGQKGVARITLTGYAKLERYECARLVTEVDLDITPAPPAEGRGRTRVRIVAYFAPAERRFIRVDASVVTNFVTRARVAHQGGPAVWSVGTLDAFTRFSARVGP